MSPPKCKIRKRMVRGCLVEVGDTPVVPDAVEIREIWADGITGERIIFPIDEARWAANAMLACADEIEQALERRHTGNDPKPMKPMDARDLINLWQVAFDLFQAAVNQTPLSMLTEHEANWAAVIDTNFRQLMGGMRAKSNTELVK